MWIVHVNFVTRQAFKSDLSGLIKGKQDAIVIVPFTKMIWCSPLAPVV
tara:strand:+ start:863 stop:1006 length:144 start_codon:yes stop_codon:yes gene_type:complete